MKIIRQIMVIALAILLAAWVLGRSAAPAHPAAHHTKSAKGAIMADTYTVSGAGSTQFNQDYNESSGPDNYSSSDTFETLFYNTNAANGPVNSWILTDVVGNPPAYYAAGTLLAGPAGLDYNVGSAGTSPAPTVSGGDPRVQIGSPGTAFALPSSGASPPFTPGIYNAAGTKVSDMPTYSGSTVSGGTHGWTITIASYPGDLGTITVQSPSHADATYAVAGQEYTLVYGASGNFAWGNFVLLPATSARRRSPAIHF